MNCKLEFIILLKFVLVFFFLAHKLPEKPYYTLNMGNCEQAVLINEKLEAIITYWSECFVPSSGSDTCLSLSAPLSSDDTAAFRLAFLEEDFGFFFLLPFFPKFHWNNSNKIQHTCTSIIYWISLKVYDISFTLLLCPFA